MRYGACDRLQTSWRCRLVRSFPALPRCRCRPPPPLPLDDETARPGRRRSFRLHHTLVSSATCDTHKHNVLILGTEPRVSSPSARACIRAVVRGLLTDCLTARAGTVEGHHDASDGMGRVGAGSESNQMQALLTDPLIAAVHPPAAVGFPGLHPSHVAELAHA